MEKLLVSTTWGLTDPTRAGLAFATAMTAKMKGGEVILFLFHDAVLLARKETYKKAIPIGPPPIADYMEYPLAQKVKILVCKACYLVRGLLEADLVDTAELQGIDTFVDLTKECKVVSF